MYTFGEMTIMLFGAFEIFNLVTSSADSTSVRCSSKNLPPWVSLIWFSSGPVDSLVNGHKQHAKTTLRWQRVWVMVEVLFCDLWSQNRQKIKGNQFTTPLAPPPFWWIPSVEGNQKEHPSHMELEAGLCRPWWWIQRDWLPQKASPTLASSLFPPQHEGFLVGGELNWPGTSFILLNFPE